MAERLRSKIEQTMSFTMSGGVATAQKGDTPVALFLRVDSALYSAKGAGRNCVFSHNGDHAEAARTNVLRSLHRWTTCRRTELQNAPYLPRLALQIDSPRGAWRGAVYRNRFASS